MRVVLVPGVLALLPEYAGLEDPVPELRAACVAAVRWLGADPVVLADPQGERVGRALLTQAGGAPATGTGAGTVADAPPARVLVVGNGSAKRTEKAPGFLDERAAAFDAALGASLRAGRPEVDAGLAAELWASVAGIERLAGLGDLGPAQVDYDDDPFGVQYWVLRWQP
ncbi:MULTISPECIES: hypothetical protein [unclassified Nocardioides]|uniref:hypothetical protein n=1 Tax=unclassified Nocardioides TaxID=2615069 RepID=UPI000056FBD6|nr:MULTISPECIES: hypothetical protein [unclassified Nocardioides]ABL83652.1 conserved hypothetical protein [Nocardioides sp. JS614]